MTHAQMKEQKAEILGSKQDWERLYKYECKKASWSQSITVLCRGVNPSSIITTGAKEAMEKFDNASKHSD